MARIAFFLACASALFANVAFAQDKDGLKPSPENSAFRGRLKDSRIAYINWGSDDNYISRWHLERRDPNAVSDVVDPITYLIDPDVPEAWHPYIDRAVEEWRSIFDSLGFRHTLVVRVAADKDSASSLRNIVRIHRGSGPDSGAMGMATTCRAVPSTSQITYCEINLNGGQAFGKLGRIFCNSKMVLSDPAIPLSCPDSVLGAMFQAVLGHEVGHSLGLDHNFFAVNAYPTDSLRSPNFVHRQGSVPSIMGYGTYNLVAQPEDHVPVAERWMRVGPYDRFAIAWAYQPIPNAKTPEDERETLERWRSAQDTAVYLRQGEAVFNQSSMTGDDWIKAIELTSRNRIRTTQRLLAQDTAAALQELEQMDLAKGMVGRFALVLAQLDGSHGQMERQLEIVRLILSKTLYGQDLLIRLLDTVSGRAKAQLQHVEADSIPFLFDTSSTGRFPSAAKWQDAQQTILKNLVVAIPLMVPAAVPQVCRYLSDAIRALTRIETEAPPALQASARTLRTTLASPLACSSSPEASR